VNTLSPATAEDAQLDQGARELLDFERGWWRRSGPKERRIRERFGFSATRYHQLLNRVIDLPEALAHDPMLVLRLRRLRETRREQRFLTAFGSCR